MPVLLTTEAEADQWLTAPVEEALELRRSLAFRSDDDRRKGRAKGRGDMTSDASPRRLSALATIGALALTACLVATPALAASLDISGEYGDEAGCKLARGDVAGEYDGGIYLTSDSYGGKEWSCSFSWTSEGEDFGGEYTDSGGKTRTLFAWTVIALCSLEGMAWPEVLAIQDGGETMAITSTAEPNSEPTILKKCPAQ